MALRIEDLPVPPVYRAPSLARVTSSSQSKAGDEFYRRAQAEAATWMREGAELKRQVEDFRTRLMQTVAETKATDAPLDFLDRIIDQLFATEDERRRENLPSIQSIQRHVENIDARRDPAKLGLIYRRPLQLWADLGADILEALRDARVQLEIFRAEKINRGQPASPVFDNAEDALAHLRALRG